jgi:hypothetical protein
VVPFEGDAVSPETAGRRQKNSDATYDVEPYLIRYWRPGAKRPFCADGRPPKRGRALDCWLVREILSSRAR